MLWDKSIGNLAGPLVAGALLVALLWAAVELGPIAATRWFGQ